MEMKRHQSDHPSPHVFTRCRACISFIHSIVGVLDNHVVSLLNICLYLYLSRMDNAQGHLDMARGRLHAGIGLTDAQITR